MRIWRKLLGLSRSIKLDTESWSDVRAFLELVWCKEGMYMQPCGSSSRGTRGGFMGFMGFPCIDCTLAFLGAWISARTYFGGVVDGISWIWLVMEVLRFLEWKFICGWRVAESRWYSFPHSSFRPRHPCSFLRDGIGGLVLPITLRLVKISWWNEGYLGVASTVHLKRFQPTIPIGCVDLRHIDRFDSDTVDHRLDLRRKGPDSRWPTDLYPVMHNGRRIQPLTDRMQHVSVRYLMSNDRSLCPD